MRRLDYLLNTSKGNYQAHINRFLRRIRFEIEQEPCSKKSMREPEKRDFHEQVNAYMQTKNRRSFRGPVIMQLDFFPSKGNPPSIQHLTKNYIDLLYRRSTQQHYKFPLLDDRQISILIVNYHVQFPVKNPNIKISMTSLGDYLKDLKLLSLVKSGHIFAKDDWYNGYDTNEIFNPDNINIDFERAYDLLLEHRELILDYGEEDSGGEFENVLVKEAQAAFLSLNRFVPSDLANIHYTKLSGIGSSTDNTFSFNRKWSISTPFDTLKPLTLPTQEGDTEIFKERVRQTMDEFSKQFPLLKPLLTNLSLTILYVPPKNQDIDLDNLARYIVPLVNEAIKPPTSFWFSEVPKKFPEYTIIQYQVIKLPRSFDDPLNGLVSILLNEYKPFNNIWEETDAVLQRWSDVAFD